MSSREGTGEHYLTAVMFTGWLLPLLNHVSTIPTFSTCSPPSSDQRPPVLTHCHWRPKMHFCQRITRQPPAVSVGDRCRCHQRDPSLMIIHNRPLNMYFPIWANVSWQFLTSSSHYAATGGLSSPFVLVVLGLGWILLCRLFSLLRLSKMFWGSADLVRGMICADVGEPGATVRHVVSAAAQALEPEHFRRLESHSLPHTPYTHKPDHTYHNLGTLTHSHTHILTNSHTHILTYSSLNIRP